MKQTRCNASRRSAWLLVFVGAIWLDIAGGGAHASAQIPTTTVVTSSQNPSIFSNPVTFTATVTDNTGTAVTRGSVNFPGYPSGLLSLDSNGQAMFTITSLNLGTQTIKANYQDTFGNNPSYLSSSGSIVQDAQHPITLALLSSLNPSTTGASVSFTATLECLNLVAPSGTISFLDGATLLVTVPVNSLGPPCDVGQSIFTTSMLSQGSHMITAVYSGDSLTTPATSPAITQIVQLVTTTMLLPQASTLSFRKPFTLSVTVQAAQGTPSGTVTFMDGSSTLGQPVTLNQGSASVMAWLTVGSHVITAQYSGDQNNAPSTMSAALYHSPRPH